MAQSSSQELSKSSMLAAFKKREQAARKIQYALRPIIWWRRNRKRMTRNLAQFLERRVEQADEMAACERKVAEARENVIEMERKVAEAKEKAREMAAAAALNAEADAFLSNSDASFAAGKISGAIGASGAGGAHSSSGAGANARPYSTSTPTYAALTNQTGPCFAGGANRNTWNVPKGSFENLARVMAEQNKEISKKRKGKESKQMNMLRFLGEESEEKQGNGKGQKKIRVNENVKVLGVQEQEQQELAEELAEQAQAETKVRHLIQFGIDEQSTSSIVNKQKQIEHQTVDDAIAQQNLNHETIRHYLGTIGNQCRLYLGIDSDSAVSGSTQKSDFVVLDNSKVTISNRELVGVGGGIAKVGGVGPQLTCCPDGLAPNGELCTVFICDPEGNFIEKARHEDMDNRIQAVGRLKTMQTILRGDDVIYQKKERDALVCKRSGWRILLTYSQQILVARTERHDARQYRKNQQLMSLIQRIKEGKCSPILVKKGKGANCTFHSVSDFQ